VNFSVRYETYHTRILFFERYVRTLTYSILEYAVTRVLCGETANDLRHLI